MAIVINSTTGEIDLDQTTPGTYVVTYTVQGVSSTQEVTVNAADNAGFSYSASSYEPTDADPTPTITGLTGGTFSAGSGLVFVDSGTNTGSSTGEIDLSASTVATHTITYDTTSSGSSVCPNTSTQTVEIALAGIANNYSMNFDSASSDYIDAGTAIGDLIGDNYAGSLTASLWFKRSSTALGGIINFTTSQFGEFTVFAYSNEIRFAINGNFYNIQYNSAAGYVYDTDWHHLAVVMTPNGSVTDIKMYFDGQLLTITPAGSSPTPSLLDFAGKKLLIGTLDVTNYPFNGKIDEVGIWNTALTSTQVQSIYDATGTNLTKDLTTVSGSNLIYWNRMGD
jgi:hypothetical protein